MTNDYRNLTDEGIEAHDASLREQMKDLVAERARRCELDMWPALTMITDHLDTLADGSLQSLVVAWSTHGSKIDAELARRAEAKREVVITKGHAPETFLNSDGTFDPPRPPSAAVAREKLIAGCEANVRSAFANMLKENNPGLDDPAADRLLKDIAEQPEEPEEPRFEVCVRMHGGKDWLHPAATNFRAQGGSLRLFSSSGGEVALIAPGEWTAAWKRPAQ